MEAGPSPLSAAVSERDRTDGSTESKEIPVEVSVLFRFCFISKRWWPYKTERGDKAQAVGPRPSTSVLVDQNLCRNSGLSP